ncbi:MAG: hypothetical protein EHM35_07260 [Planctomycetaceae bacterium]|nr:MAG: hypothetical protein EHM35_07260 [Planctomycetaceae bacterium]
MGDDDELARRRGIPPEGFDPGVPPPTQQELENGGPTQRARDIDEDHIRALSSNVSDLLRQLESTKPEWDATDGAHPCWWRGHDNGADGMRAALADARRLLQLNRDYRHSDRTTKDDWLTLDDEIDAYVDGYSPLAPPPIAGVPTTGPKGTT